MRVTTKHVFPSSLGVIGEVFKTQRIVATSEVSELKSFIPTLDNHCPNVKQMESIVVAPIFGHKNPDGSRNLIAILQLLNKLDGVVNQHDIVSTL